MKHFLLFFAFTCAISAAPIVNSFARCEDYDRATDTLVQAQVGREQCNIAGDDDHTSTPFARTQSFGGMRVLEEGFGNTLLTSAQVLASAYWSLDYSHYGVASGSVQYRDFYRTAGGTRPGIVFYGFYFSGSGGGGAETAYQSFEDSPKSQSGEMAITLGVQEAVFIWAHTGANPIFASGNDATATVILSFFEADGVTPVSVYVVPEPSTFVFGGLGILVVTVLRRYRSK